MRKPKPSPLNVLKKYMNFMGHYNYQVNDVVLEKIASFYENAAIAHLTYPFETMEKNIKEAYDAIRKIENGFIGRRPTISRWQRDGWQMANSRSKKKRWYFAYRIDGDTIYVEDACHAQNMHETMARDKNPFPISTRKFVAYIITEKVMRKIRQLI